MENFLENINIEKPALLIDKKKMNSNIKKMSQKAENSGVELRHHAKTHQSHEIASKFKDLDNNSITVSSVDMAYYFAEKGWNHITIAFPTNILELDRINILAEKIDLELLIDSQEVVKHLDKNLDESVKLWVKIDVGYGRAGIEWRNTNEIMKIVEEIQKTQLSFEGILTHAGHIYKSSDKQELQRIHQETINRMNDVKKHLEVEGVNECRISIGNTPSCSNVDEFDQVDEIRPGNFVFYDLKQYTLGSCKENDIAVAVACPVVGKYPDRNKILLHGGGVHLSVESIEGSNREVFGYLAKTNDKTWTGIDCKSPVVSLSQEHGLVRVSNEKMKEVEIGDVLPVLPIHSCMTANLFPYYKSLKGERIPKFQSIRK